MFCSTSAFSTFTQFGAVGTNQLDDAAFANGASCGLSLLTLASVVVFGMLPTFASPICALELVNALIQSAASDVFLLPAGIARSEPPRNSGISLPLTWLGIGYAATCGASAGLPVSLFSANGHSQPLPMKEATCPLAKTSPCHGCASSFVLLARERARTIRLATVTPFTAFGWLRVPTPFPPLRTAIWPP